MIELQSVWGWQPALYLFLGGLGAGTFVAAMAMMFKDFEAHKKTVAAAAVGAVACLCAGLLLLLTELTNPLRGLMMWQSFSNGSSWMTVGAWLLFAAIVVMVCECFLVFEPAWRLAGRIAFVAGRRGFLMKAFGGVGALLGLGVAVYTGILLMSAPGVPLWNTPLLPCIFTASALDTGVALVMLVDLFARGDAEASARARRVAEVATVCLVAFEAVCVAVFCQVMLNGGTLGPAVSGSEAETAVESVGVLLTGELAPLFWGWFVVAGLVVPFVCALVGLVAKEGVGRVVGALGGAFALVGGCVLRFVVLMAGLHADILADAVSAIVFH